MFPFVRRIAAPAVVNRVLGGYFKPQINTVQIYEPCSVIKTQYRLKSQRSVKKKALSRNKEEVESGSDTDEQEDDNFDDQITDKNTKIMEFDVKSLRVDGILKHVLGVARNKIDTWFYDSKIRINGEKMLKKSALASEGDEIDVIRGISPNNPALITVARVEVLSIKQRKESFDVKIRRCKNLLVEKYND